ncbi:ATP-binding cassette sub- A member 5 [Blyttiomyces sp. JEL0837]|nr:ATP-binding cassette sub- A member 5 [Blyttiomyces sp. JEL0837]
MGYIYNTSTVSPTTLSPLLNQLYNLLSESEGANSTGSNRDIKDVVLLKGFNGRDDMTSFQGLYPGNLVTAVEFFALLNESSLETSYTYSIWINDTVFIQDYISTYYVTAQAYLNRAIINNLRNTTSQSPSFRSPLKYTPTNGLLVATIPQKQTALAGIVSYYFVLLFQNVVGNVLLRMATERGRIKNGLVVMGMDETVYMTSICFVQFLFTLPIISAVVLVTCTFGNIFQYTAPSLLLVTLLLYTMSATTMGAVLQVPFPDQRQSAAISFLTTIFTLSWYAIGSIFILDKPSMSVILKYLWLLIPQAALARVIGVMAGEENVLRGVSWGSLNLNLDDGNPGGKVGVAVLMLVVDVFVWWGLSWYFNLRFPGGGVSGLERLFFLRPGWWRRRKSGGGDADLGDVVDVGDGDVMDQGENNENIEPVDFSGLESEECKNGVRIKKVRKEFVVSGGDEKGKAVRRVGIFGLFGRIWKWFVERRSGRNSKKLKVALDGFSLDLHRGQTLALLGHNGAGKTTLISIISGILPPSSGTVNIKIPVPTTTTNQQQSFKTLSSSNPHHRNQITKHMGVCPQFDILFDELTCREHLKLYAALKGVVVSGYVNNSKSTATPPNYANLLDEYITALLHDVGISNKINSRTSSLSGGQKRKVSLSISLLGNPSLLLLDEPTTGMDVDSITIIWKLIQEVKKNKIVLLTTHSMEEADSLGDRICVMGKGKLQACGSGLFLKGRFGVGVRLFVDVVAGELGKSCLGKVLDIVRGFVDNARLEGEGDEEGLLTRVILVPTVAKDGGKVDLAGMFETLMEGRKAGVLKGVLNIGVGQSTLEEVFLKLKDEDDKAEREEEGPEGAESEKDK